MRIANRQGPIANGLADISRELGLLGVEWDMPGLGPMWQFTNAEGITFYAPAGSSLEAVAERLEEKLEQFGAAPGERSFAA